MRVQVNFVLIVVCFFVFSLFRCLISFVCIFIVSSLSYFFVFGVIFSFVFLFTMCLFPWFLLSILFSLQTWPSVPSVWQR